MPGVVLNALEMRSAPRRLAKPEAPRAPIFTPDVGGAPLLEEAGTLDRGERTGILEHPVHLEHERLADVVPRVERLLHDGDPQPAGVLEQHGGERCTCRATAEVEDIGFAMPTCGHFRSFSSTRVAASAAR